MNNYSPREEELLARLTWFVKLRWLFLLALGGLLFFAEKLFYLKVAMWQVLIISAVVLLYNLGFYFYHLFLIRSRYKVRPRGLRIEANLQIGLDLMALVLLVHYSGGIENPFIFFFIFHIIMGSILLTGRDIWFHAVWTIFALFTLLGLSYLRVINHYHIQGFASDQLWNNTPYVMAGAVAFGTTIIMTAYMTNSISRSVLHRENELFLAKNQLEKKSEELEQANKELIRQQSLLIQTEKLASLGKLSAGIAHELNNPMTGILSFSHFIKDACPANDQVQHDIGVVIKETERCKKIIKGLLDYARQSATEKKTSDIIQLLKKTITLIEHHKDFRDIEIIQDVDLNIPQIMFDQDQIQQVFMNIIVNAQEAMTSNGTIYIKAQMSADQKFVEIKFKDTGPGMDEETMNKIFDPFFTTKEMGTGLGLSISLGIIEKHHGKLEVESAAGKGSTFIVRIPVNGE